MKDIKRRTMKTGNYERLMLQWEELISAYTGQSPLSIISALELMRIKESKADLLTD